MKKLLIIEDDIWIQTGLKLYIQNFDFEIDSHYTWEWASQKALEGNYDIILLDINLPIVSGIEICREIRKKSSVPIIMITARNEESDRVMGLEIGADDYITKPFSPRELVARINSILRRITASNNEEKTDENVLFYRDFKVFIDKNIVKKAEKEIILTKHEFNIFRFILEANWSIVSRDSLMKEIIWYDRYIYDRTLDTHIKNLRKKLWDKDIILTVRGEWYKINI